MGRRIALLLLMFCLSSVHAATDATEAPNTDVVETDQPYTFATWKEKHITDATNQLLKMTTRFSQLRAKRGESADPAEKPLSNKYNRVRPAPADLTMAEKDVRRARESLEAARGLEISDYVSIYLPTLSGQPAVQQQLIKKLSPDDMALILQLLLNQPKSDNAKHQDALMGGLVLPRKTLN
ncbi:MAG: hypothetical protein AB7F86_16200 [Bdellovibrionales bacterium]